MIFGVGHDPGAAGAGAHEHVIETEYLDASACWRAAEDVAAGGEPSALGSFAVVAQQP
jgi:hypothetical protein